MYKKLLIFVVFLFPSVSFGATYLGCADLTVQGAGASCTGDVFTIPSGGYIQTSHSIGLRFNQSATYYLSAVVTGSGTGGMKVEGNTNDGSPVAFNPGNVSNLGFATPAGNSNNWLSMFANNPDFVGTIAQLCYSTSQNDCVITSPPPPDKSATSTIDQTQDNVWNAFWVFFAMVVFVVWLGRTTK